MSDPQTAADAAAEELGTWLASRGVDDQLGHDLRAVLEDRKRMAAELEQVRGAGVPQFVWMHGNNEHSSQIAYVALRDAQEDAIWEYDPNLAEEPERWTWQPVIGTGALQLCCDGEPVPYEVYRVPVGLPSAPHDTKAESAYWRSLADQYFAERLGMDGTAASAAPDGAGDTQTAEQRADGKRTPEQWCAEYGIDIRDPDGWRGKGDPAWGEPITLPDFFRRAVRSTCWRVTTDVWNRIGRDAHRVADAEREGGGP
jgi:hypothetical protein